MRPFHSHASFLSTLRPILLEKLMDNSNTQRTRLSKKGGEQATWLWKLQPTAIAPPLSGFRSRVVIAVTVGTLAARWLITR